MPLPESYLRGAVSTVDRTTDVHPEDWDGKVYEYIPIGHVPFTGVLDAMPKKVTRSRHIHWWEEPFAKQRGTVTDVYTDQLLSSAYASGGVEDAQLYLKMSSDDASQIVIGMTLLVGNTSTMGYVNCDVLNLNIAGANSWVLVALLEDDTDDDLAGANLVFQITGDAQEEGSELPEADGRDVTELVNQSQIFMGALEITGTEIEEETRIDQAILPTEKRKAQMRLMCRREWSNFFGVYKTKYGSRGKPRRFMEGVVSAIKRRTALGLMDTRVYNYKTAAAYSGKTWLSGGWDFLKGILNDTSKTSTGSSVKDVYLGQTAWQAIVDLVEDRGHYKIETLQGDFGIRVTKIYGLNKALHLIEHPLFTESPFFTNTMFITEMNLFKERPFRNRGLKYIPANQTATDGYVWRDGVKAGWMYEGSLQYNNLEAMAWVVNLGVTNTA